MKKYFVTLFALLFVELIFAQEISTDRPDQTEAASTLPARHFQFETGSFLETDNETESWTINTNLFRYGIMENLELRMVTELSKLRIKTSNESEIGTGDLEMGLKFRIINNGIELSYLGHVIIPSGDENFSSGTTGFSNKLLLAHQVSENIDFGYNFGIVNFDTDYSFTYSYAISFGLTEKTGFYTEVYGDWFRFENFYINYDSGFTLLVKQNLQIDFSIGTGITEKYNYYSVGLSWRLPN